MAAEQILYDFLPASPSEQRSQRLRDARFYLDFARELADDGELSDLSPALMDKIRQRLDTAQRIFDLAKGEDEHGEKYRAFSGT